MVAKLDSSSRLAKLTPGVLSTSANAVFEQAVHDARELAHSTSGIITLVAKNVQYFRTAVGLPEEFSVSRATSRCDSFCQFVVKSESAFVVFDTEHDSRVPRRLADAYGIRAYCGVPVRIDSEVAGSLCVFDDKPRDFDGEVISGMSEIAERVSDELLREWRSTKGASNDSQLAAESAALVRLADAEDAGALAPALVQRGRWALDELDGALGRAVSASPPEVATMILMFLEELPADQRSFALAKLVLTTNFPSSTEPLTTLQRTVGAAIDKLRVARRKS